ncbi:protein argonaute 16-like [Tasmannia lanceolata]|uniref:protein argonaute 16-like n=1 Tax=Tasmannia lanceolata TaxID=3420 RepID=UPI004062E5CA
MGSPKEKTGAMTTECLPPPPVAIPPNIVPARVDLPKRLPIARPGFGSDGGRIQLLANHFGVRFSSHDGIFFHYNVSITFDDKKAVEVKGISRKVMDKLYQTYGSELSGKQFAYDGEKSLFTVGPLPQNNFEFTVVLEESSVKRGSPDLNGSPSETDRKRSKRSYLAKTFTVQISFAAKIPMKPIAMALKGNMSTSTQDALRVLDIILRQNSAKRGCLLVRQSFFHADVRNFTDIGGGVTGVRGFHSSFCATQGGLSLNMDVSTTMILTPGPVLDFLLANQNVRDPSQIDWIKAKKMLKNMRIRTKHNCMEFKIIGISDKPCNQQFFSLKVRNGDGINGEGQTVEVTVYDYFVKKNIELTYSAYLPCLDVGKPKRPNYLPLELCSLVSLQRYTKALSTMQRSSLVEKSRQKPQERIKVVNESLKNSRYDEDVLLSACGISIDKQLTQLEGRVLNAPTLKVGNSADCIPTRGRWNFNNKKVWAPTRIERWAVVNFSARCDTSHISRELINCGRNKGIHIDRPFTLIEEDPQWKRAGPIVRVERMFDQIMSKLPGPPQFLLCVLPDRKNSTIYGPWKKKNLHEMGIATQCIAPIKINDQYLTNVLLKINSKLGGTNSLLAVEHSPCIPLLNKTPTMILGMDVSHGSPGQSDIPSVAAVVGSREWPLISRYRASVRTQSPKVEMIDSLYKPLPNGEDDGIMRELLMEFYRTSNHQKPSQIIIFRDGVSESQFNQVLNIELEQIIKSINHLEENWLPKFTVIVAQKNHHTKLFQSGSPDNVPPGTVVDTKIVHPRNYDFYMCAHFGMIGTSRPTHYHVLLDEIGFSPDELQKLVHSLSYVYQRSTTAISIVAPINYAHLAAQQMMQFIKFEDFSDTSSGHGGVSVAGTIPVPELPRLHENVRSSMFFC